MGHTSPTRHFLHTEFGILPPCLGPARVGPDP